MNCPSCSAPVEGAFCSRCGARVPPPASVAGYQYQGQTQPGAAPNPPGYSAPPQPFAYPPAPYISRVASHLKTLGILWCVYAGYRLLAGIAASFFLLGMRNSGFFARFNPNAGFPFGSLAPMMGGIAAAVAVLSICAAALAVFTGISLLNRKSWGRTLGIVAAILSLIKFPLGTALGIYTLWVLVPRRSGVEYDAMADHS